MTANATILIAEDDAALRDMLCEILSRVYRVIAVEDGTRAKQALVEQTIDVVVSDIRMPGADGLALLRAAQATTKQPPVILLTAYGSITQAVEAMRLGAFDYLSKPLDSPEILRNAVARALSQAGPGARTAITAVYVDPAALALLELIDKVARHETTVLLQGETGVGKEVAAREVHSRSLRAVGPFVAINCGAIPAHLTESTFFGHARGAFTGADKDRIGLFEAASGGTLFLDEIGELGAPEQAALLRALEERRVRRVGDVRDRPIDVRVIAATHRELGPAVNNQRFREDLYYRLAEFPIHIAPLRDRPGDILPLAHSFLAASSHADFEFSKAAEARLLAHRWPGNARELRNVVSRASILAGGRVIDESHLDTLATSHARAERTHENGKVGTTLQDIERWAIEDALEATGGNRRATAERLGISLRGLQYKLKTYHLTRG